MATECPLLAAISTGRRNTLTKTQNVACMLMNLKETLRPHGRRESGAVGPLEASRALKSSGRAFDEPSIVCLSPVGPAQGDRDPSREE